MSPYRSKKKMLQNLLSLASIPYYLVILIWDAVGNTKHYVGGTAVKEIKRCKEKALHWAVGGTLCLLPSPPLSRYQWHGALLTYLQVVELVLG